MDRPGHDRMVVGSITTYQCLSPITLWVRIPRRWGVLDTTLCDQVCQWLATGQWFSSGTPVSSTNKTDCQDITEIVMKVVSNTITLSYLLCMRVCVALLFVFWACPFDQTNYSLLFLGDLAICIGDVLACSYWPTVFYL